LEIRVAVPSYSRYARDFGYLYTGHSRYTLHRHTGRPRHAVDEHSSGTPGTVIPGTPGSPGLACPGPPAVISAAAAHKESLILVHPAREAGQTLPSDRYEVAWEGLGPVAQVSILKRGRPVANAKATVVALGKDAPANDTAWRTNPDGSFSLDLLQFKGRNFALRFDP